MIWLVENKKKYTDEMDMILIGHDMILIVKVVLLDLLNNIGWWGLNFAGYGMECGGFMRGNKYS